MDDSDANYSDSGKVTRGEPELNADADSVHNDSFGDLVHSASALQQRRQSQRGTTSPTSIARAATAATKVHVLAVKQRRGFQNSDTWQIVGVDIN